MEKPLNVFCCYAPVDLPYLLRLKQSLLPLEQHGLITIHTSSDTLPGEHLQDKFRSYLATAHIILLLFSTDFLASDIYQFKDMQEALDRHNAGTVLTIPIMIRPVNLQLTPFGAIPLLPTGEKPVAEWRNRDEAFRTITGSIMEAVETLLKTPLPFHDQTLKDYLHWLKATTNQLILPQGKHRIALTLENIYVALKGDKTSDYEYGQARALLDNEIEGLRDDILAASEAMGAEEYIERRRSALQKSPFGPLYEEHDLPGQSVTPFAQVLSLAQAFQMERRLIILGDPGSGKTTLIEWLALKLASALEDALAHQGTGRVTVPTAQAYPDLATVIDMTDLGPARLPILVRVANYATEYKKRNGKISLRNYLGLQPWRGKEPARTVGDTTAPIAKADLQALFTSYIRLDRAVILLDGLDEVTDNREQIAQEIELFISTIKGKGEPLFHGGNQVVITSRIAGYRFSPLRGENLTHVVIEAMQRPAVEQFCKDLIAAMPDHEGQAEQRAQGLINAIYAEENRHIRELASNPLLLTMLAFIYEQQQTLPQRRASLYNQVIHDLINQVWKTTKMVEAGGNNALLEALSGVAAYIHEAEPSGLLLKSQLSSKLFEYLPKKGQAADVEVRIAALIDTIDNETGLLAARGDQLYGFLHLTFQEYLAGRYLVRNKQQAHQQILKYIDIPRWREPILLALGYIGESSAWQQAEREQFLERLLHAPDPLQRFLPRMALLLAKILPEMGRIKDTITTEVVRQLFTVYSNQSLTTEYHTVQVLIEQALVALRTDRQQKVDRALITLIKADPSLISALAQLMHKYEWFTRDLVELVYDYIDHDSPERDWSANRVLQHLVTPAAEQSSPVEPVPPEAPAVRYYNVRKLKEVLSNWESDEALSLLLAKEIKFLYQRNVEQGEADTATTLLQHLNTDDASMPVDLLVLQQLFDVVKGEYSHPYFKALQELLDALKDTNSRDHLEKAIKKEENAYQVYLLEYKQLSTNYAIAAAAYRESKQKQQLAARAPLSLERLKMKSALNRNQDWQLLIQHDPDWLRLISAFYGGFGDYQASYWLQQYRVAAAISAESSSWSLAPYRERVSGQADIPLVTTFAAQQNKKQDANYRRTNQVPAFQVDYLYRDTPLHQELLNALILEEPASSLDKRLWELWSDELAGPEKRRDALVALALLGQDVIQPLSQSFTSEDQADLAEQVLLKMAQIASSLQDAAIRSQRTIMRQLPSLHSADPQSWIDFLQIVMQTLIVANQQPINLRSLIERAPEKARPLLEADSWFFLIVASLGYTFDPGIAFAQQLQSLRKQLQQVPPSMLADNYTRALASAWRAPNIAAAPLLNLPHAWQLDPLAPESTDATDISIDLLDGLLSFYAMDTLHPLYSSMFRTYILMGFREQLEQNRDLLPEVLLLCLPYILQEPQLISNLEPDFLQAKEPVLYLAQKSLLIAHPFYRARALLRLLPFTIASTAFVPFTARECMASIQAAYEEIQDLHQKLVIMERFIQYQPVQQQDALLQQLYQHACQIPHSVNRVRALIRLTRLSPSEQQPILLAAALTEVGTVADEYSRAELLYQLELRSRAYPILAERLYKQTQTLSSDWLQAKARGLLATHLLQSSATWAGSVKNQTLWTPLLVSASFYEIYAHFLPADGLETAWMQLAHHPSYETLSVLLDQGAESGLLLTGVAVQTINQIIAGQHRHLLHNLLPLLHSPSSKDMGVIESWLGCSDPFIAHHAALFITETSRQLTPRYIPHLLALLHDDTDRSRYRVHAMITNGLETSTDRHRTLRVSTLGAATLERFIADSLHIDDFGRRHFSPAYRITVDTIHDAPGQLQRWIQAYSASSPKDWVKKYILEQIEDITVDTLDILLAALTSNDIALHAKTALLYSVCTLAVTQRKNKPLFQRILPVLCSLPHETLDTISVLTDRYKAVVDVARTVLADHREDQRDLVTRMEELLASRDIKLSSVLDLPDNMQLAHLTKIGDTFFIMGDGTTDPKITEAARMVEQNTETFQVLLHWLRQSLEEFIAQDDDDPHQKRNALLCVMAAAARKMPATFATQAQPEIFEPRLIFAACHSTHWQSRCAALELLGQLRFVTGNITELLKYTLKDDRPVQQAMLNLINNLPSLQPQELTDLIDTLCNDEMLYHESASLVYIVATILSVLGRKATLEQEQRMKIQNALATAAADPRSRRGVYSHTANYLAGGRLKIDLQCRLNQAIFHAVLETVGVL